jgi:hypothetical protein
MSLEDVRPALLARMAAYGRGRRSVFAAASLCSFLYLLAIELTSSAGSVSSPTAKRNRLVREGDDDPVSRRATNDRLIPDANASPSWLMPSAVRRALSSAENARSSAGS